MQIDMPQIVRYQSTCNLPHQSDPMYWFCKQTMTADRRIFPFSPPPPSFISQPVVLSLAAAFDSLQPSSALQDGSYELSVIQRSRSKSTPALQAGGNRARNFNQRSA